MPKHLVVNADDFGFTSDVNSGIVESHCKGILTAATLMANGDAFDDAVRLARATPSLDIGCHLTLVQGQSLFSGAPLPATPKLLVRALLARRIHPYRELRPQVERIAAAGIRPSHFDTHKHTHVLPPVFNAVCRLAREFDVPFVRLPFDADWRAARPFDWWYRSRLRAAGLRATDHFLGFRLTGELTEASLARSIDSLPEGSTELMCHPGILSSELAGAATRLKESRERERAALTSPAIRQLVERKQIVLTSYRALAGLPNGS